MRARISGGAPRGIAHVPPSKSILHRALICAALARGESGISNYGHSEDVSATETALVRAGARVVPSAAAGGEWLVHGIGGIPLPPEEEESAIQCGASASTLRFLLPLFTLSDAPARFEATEALPDRPMGAYEEVYRQRGLLFEREGSLLTAQGPLPAGQYVLPGTPSSQFVSGLLLALPMAGGFSTITIRPPVTSRSYIEMTRKIQLEFGIHSHWMDDNSLLVPGRQRYQPGRIVTEGDYSAASAMLVLSAMFEGVKLAGLPASSVFDGEKMAHVSSPSIQGDRVILDILSAFGRPVGWEDGFALCRHPGPLHAPERPIDLTDCPDLAPAISTLALFAEGETHMCGTGRLRYKECDRMVALQEELGKMGARIEVEDDSVTVFGTALTAPTQPLDCRSDHRIAMALAAAAVCAGVPAELDGAECVRKSWPGFFYVLAGLGVRVDSE